VSLLPARHVQLGGTPPWDHDHHHTGHRQRPRKPLAQESLREFAANRSGGDALRLTLGCWTTEAQIDAPLPPFGPV